MRRKNKDETLSNSEVITHTASMWKYNVIPDYPEPYPEYLTSYEKTNGYEITAARVRGKKHKHEGSNCDDWYDYRIVGDIVIAAVSDGAGSKLLSRIGAKAACEAVTQTLGNDFTVFRKKSKKQLADLRKPLDNPDFTAVCGKLAQIMQNSFIKAYEAVETEYLKRRGCEELTAHMGKAPELADFSCTLLATAAIPVKVNGEREHFVISVQVGDGIIASVNGGADFNSALRVLGIPDSGGFAGETEFITSGQYRTHSSLMSRTIIQRGKITDILLMSDGVADDYYPNNPELLRLYLDLKLNGVLDGGEADAPKADTLDKKLRAAVPEPISYPWVNDGDISYAVQYASNVMEKTGLDLSRLWVRGDIIKAASLQSFGIVHEKDRAEALSVWLDNYSLRGSFDDRAMIIIRLD